MTECTEHGMRAGGRNIGSSGSVQVAAVVRGRPVLEADGSVGKAQAAREGRKGQE